MGEHEARTIICSVKVLRNKGKMNRAMHKCPSNVYVKGNSCLFLIPALKTPFISCKHSPAPTTLNLYLFIFILPCAQKENINVAWSFAGVFPVQRHVLGYFLFYFLYLDTCFSFNSLLTIHSFFSGLYRLFKNLHHEKMPLDMTCRNNFDLWI